MKQFEITEAQEWQLFEMLEGNLSAEEAALLHQDIESQPALAYHFNLLKQTYTSAPDIHFPEAQSLKKQPRNKQVYLWISTAAAAAIALLLLWKPISTLTNKSSIEAQDNMVQIFEKSKLNEGLEMPSLNPDNASKEESERSANTISPAKSPATKNLAGNFTTEKIHPLITATNDFRSQKNDSQQSPLFTKIEIVKNATSNSFAQHLADQGSIGDALQFNNVENQGPQILPTPFGQNQNNVSGTETTQSPKAKLAKNPSPRKTGFALAKSFYNDGKTMIQHGHVPHVNIKTINKSHSLLPTIEMGLRLENNVIMASFNQ
jgi:hypothetical protein